MGPRVLPNPVKVALGLGLFAAFFPVYAKVVTTKLLFNELLIIYAVKEFVIGMAIGFLMSIPFTIVQSSGFIIDHARGASSLMVSDPAIQNQSSPIGLLFNFILIYVFYYLDGPFLFFEVIQHSYEVIPPDRFFSPLFFTDENLFWKQLIGMLNKFMMLSIQLGAPSIIIILMCDFFLGIANRLAPQVQIIFLGMGLKSMAPLLTMALGWYIFVDQIGKTSIEWVYQTKEMVQIMGQSVKETTPAAPEETPGHLPKAK